MGFVGNRGPTLRQPSSTTAPCRCIAGLTAGRLFRMFCSVGLAGLMVRRRVGLTSCHPSTTSSTFLIFLLEHWNIGTSPVFPPLGNTLSHVSLLGSAHRQNPAFCIISTMSLGMLVHQRFKLTFSWLFQSTSWRPHSVCNGCCPSRPCSCFNGS